MVQPWIHKAKTDSVFILAPSFIVLAIVLLFQNWLTEIEESYSFYTWLFLIVFIDVAHVYSTLFKTYFVASEFQRRKQLYIGLPIFCFLIGFILFLFGSQVFWSVLAYVAFFISFDSNMVLCDCMLEMKVKPMLGLTISLFIRLLFIPCCIGFYLQNESSIGLWKMNF